MTQMKRTMEKRKPVHETTIEREIAGMTGKMIAEMTEIEMIGEMIDAAMIEETMIGEMIDGAGIEEMIVETMTGETTREIAGMTEIEGIEEMTEIGEIIEMTGGLEEVEGEEMADAIIVMTEGTLIDETTGMTEETMIGEMIDGAGTEEMTEEISIGETTREIDEMREFLRSRIGMTRSEIVKAPVQVLLARILPHHREAHPAVLNDQMEKIRSERHPQSLKRMKCGLRRNGRLKTL
jgi:hypothetical protein